jgi:hypothetical protein
MARNRRSDRECVSADIIEALFDRPVAILPDKTDSPVDPAIAVASFGTQSICFKGNHTQFPVSLSCRDRRLCLGLCFPTVE